MPTTIVMPQLGESVAEGVIGKWLKNEGDHIDKDEPIVEVITDKVNAEIPSPVAGTLQTISQPEGATVAVGQEIAVIGDEGGSKEPVAQAATTSGNGRTESQSARPSPVEAAPTAEPGGPARGQTQQETASSSGARGDRVRSSPLVRRLAEQHDINLAEVPGTGIGGRVSKQDILSFVELQQQGAAAATQERGHFDAGTEFEREERPAAVATQAPPVAPPSPPTTAPSGGMPSMPPQPITVRPLGSNEELMPVPPLRKMIADRMVQSMYTIPHATTMAEVDMTNVVRYREAKKDEFRRQEGIPLSYVAFVIKATIEALKQHTLVNAEWAGASIILKKDININVAVDAPEGLTTPVIHHADDKSLAGLAKAIYDLAMRARDKKLKIDDMQGGTFTVNNTGALGSVGGVSIINYPQAGILNAAAIVKRPVVLEQGGQDLIAVRSMMNLSFSFDHRLLDGGYAVAFVQTVKQQLQVWPMDYPVY